MLIYMVYRQKNLKISVEHFLASVMTVDSLFMVFGFFFFHLLMLRGGSAKLCQG